MNALRSSLESRSTPPIVSSQDGLAPQNSSTESNCVWRQMNDSEATCSRELDTQASNESARSIAVVRLVWNEPGVLTPESRTIPRVCVSSDVSPVLGNPAS